MRDQKNGNEEWILGGGRAVREPEPFSRRGIPFRLRAGRKLQDVSVGSSIQWQGISFVRFRAPSTGIGRAGAKKIDPESENQLCAAAPGMRTTVQITQTVESFDGQSQAGQKPADE